MIIGRQAINQKLNMDDIRLPMDISLEIDHFKLYVRFYLPRESSKKKMPPSYVYPIP